MSNILESNNVNYHQYSVRAEEPIAEILMALLSAEPFEGFEQTENGFLAYIADTHNKEKIEVQLNLLKAQFDFEYEYIFVEKVNWNAIWEKSFEPILIEDFCMVRAPFHDSPTGIPHEIVIEPKMAFGTGHHATTFMVMETMKDLDFSSKLVLDFGCGTGILAILASKLGADKIIAIDNDPLCSSNTEENAELNQVENITPLLGAKDDIPVNNYDIIVANINRNVILDALPDLYKMLNKNGQLLISGFVVKDRELLRQHVSKHGFTIRQERVKDKWICMQLTK